MEKKQKLIFILFLAGFLFLNFGQVFALEVKNYPSVPGVQAPTDCAAGDINCLPRMITYFVGLGIYLAGAIAVISFAAGAVQYIASADSPEMHSNAKDRMKGAVLGLVIAISAIIISKSISDDLVKVALNPLTNVAGVFYTDGANKIPAPRALEVASDRPEGFDQLIYCCAEDCSGGTGPALIIWIYPGTNFKGTDELFGGVEVVKKQCGETENLGGFGSFRTAFETPGIYYFMGAGCSGYMSEALTVSENKIADPFRQNIKSIKIKNSADGGDRGGYSYGAIFHKEEGLENGGECSEPLTSVGETEACRDVNVSASAVDIFLVADDPETSGSGVSFYSEKQGWDTGAQAGFYDIPPDRIYSDFANNPENPKDFCFSYKNIIRPDRYMYKCTDSNCGGTGITTNAEDCAGPEDCENSSFGMRCINGKCASGQGCLDGSPCPELETCDSNGVCSAMGSAEGVDCSEGACETFYDCHGSIRIKGSYLVAIYAKQPENNSFSRNKPPLCQTFTDNAENLEASQILKPGVKDLDKIYIIPTTNRN